MTTRPDTHRLEKVSPGQPHHKAGWMNAESGFPSVVPGNGTKPPRSLLLSLLGSNYQWLTEAAPSLGLVLWSSCLDYFNLDPPERHEFIMPRTLFSLTYPSSVFWSLEHYDFHTSSLPWTHCLSFWGLRHNFLLVILSYKFCFFLTSLRYPVASD